MSNRDELGRFVMGHAKVGEYRLPKGSHNSPKTEFKAGLIPWNKVEHIIKHCPVCGKEFDVAPCDSDRKYCSKVCCYEGREVTHTFQSGDKHPGYIDGRAGLGYKNEFHRTKKLALERDGYKCQICNAHKHRMEVHHKDFNKNNNQLDNLITLCRSCHAKTNFHRNQWMKFFINGELLGVCNDENN